MELKRLRCPNCGAGIDPDSVNFTSRSAKCPACDTKYIVEQAQNFARVEVDKSKDIKNYRQNLSKAIDLNDAPDILRYAQLILDILPDDYEANYFFAYGKARCEDDDRHLYNFLDDDAQDCTDEAQERVANHLIKYGNVRDEKRIEGFLGRMGSSSERYLALYRKEFDQKAAEEELYDDISRDVFICHRSTDGEVAQRIVRELERDGNQCWISSRNLRPNDNENYWDDIHRAVKSCRIFLVVSSHDAMISGDVKKEIAFAKELNKKRLEVKIDDSEHTMLFKDFFDGCKWINGENYSEIKRRVSDLLLQELSGAKDANVRKQTYEFTPQPPVAFEQQTSAPPPRKSAISTFEEKYSKATTNRARIEIIRSFIVPSTPKDLLEFAVLASSNVDESLLKVSAFSQNKDATLKELFRFDSTTKQVNDAWMFKLKQIYQQAKASIRNTPEYDQIEELYEKKRSAGNKKGGQTATNREQPSSRQLGQSNHTGTSNSNSAMEAKWAVIALIASFVFIAIIFIVLGASGMFSSSNNQEETALVVQTETITASISSDLSQQIVLTNPGDCLNRFST